MVYCGVSLSLNMQRRKKYARATDSPKNRKRHTFQDRNHFALNYCYLHGGFSLSHDHVTALRPNKPRWR
jgi:hypothetical protein